MTPWKPLNGSSNIVQRMQHLEALAEKREKQLGFLLGALKYGAYVSGFVAAMAALAKWVWGIL